MGDHDRDPTLEQAIDRPLDRPLGLGVDAARRFVEDEHRRIREDRPRERHQLPLAVREPLAALAHHEVEAARHAIDEGRPRGAQRRPHLLVGGVEPAEAHVLADRVVEEPRGLLDDAELRGDPGERTLAQIDAVGEDPSPLRLIEAGDQAGEGRLAAAGRPDEGDALARFDREIDAVDRPRLPVRVGSLLDVGRTVVARRGPPFGVAEEDAFEIDPLEPPLASVLRKPGHRRLPLRFDPGPHLGRVLDLDRRVEQAFDPLRRGLRRQEIGEALREILHRKDEEERVLAEGDELAERQRLASHRFAAHPERDRRADRPDRREERRVERSLPRIAHAPGLHLGSHRRVLALRRGLAGEGLRRAHSGDRLVEEGGHHRVAPPHAPRALDHAAGEEAADHRERRHDRKHHEAERPLEPEHRRRGRAHEQRRPAQIEDHPRRHAAHPPAVGGEAREQPADRTLIEVGKRQPLKLREGVLAQVEREPRSKPARRRDEEPNRDREENREPDPRPEEKRQPLRPAVGVGLVDHAGDDERAHALDKRKPQTPADHARDRPAQRERPAEIAAPQPPIEPCRQRRVEVVDEAHGDTPPSRPASASRSTSPWISHSRA